MGGVGAGNDPGSPRGEEDGEFFKGDDGSNG